MVSLQGQFRGGAIRELSRPPLALRNAFGMFLGCILPLVWLCPVIVYPSVLLSGGPNCDDGSNTVQHAVPDTTVSVSCSVDNPNGLNILAWTIPSYGVSVSNVNGVNGADIDQPDFVSTVTSFNNTQDTTTATLSFTAVSALDGAVVNCGDVTNTISSCTLFIMSKL